MEINELKNFYTFLIGRKIVKNKTEFAEKLGFRRETISRIITGKYSISDVLVLRLKSVFKDEWELFEFIGVSEEEKRLAEAIEDFTGEEIVPVGKHIHRKVEGAFEDWPGLPMYNQPISASFVASYRDESHYEPLYYFRDPRFRDCDFGAIVTGDSMHSEIRHGDFIVCKEIKDSSFIVYGDIYYVVAKNGLETCKYLHPGNDEETLLLVPRNESIKPSPIRKEMITKLYKVRGIVRGY